MKLCQFVPKLSRSIWPSFIIIGARNVYFSIRANSQKLRFIPYYFPYSKLKTLISQKWIKIGHYFLCRHMQNTLVFNLQIEFEILSAQVDRQSASWPPYFTINRPDWHLPEHSICKLSISNMKLLLISALAVVANW